MLVASVLAAADHLKTASNLVLAVVRGDHDVNEVRLARAPDAQTRALEAQELREAVFPRVLPAYSDLHASADGHLWVRETPMQLGGPHVWAVFAPDGRPLGSAELPAPLVVDDGLARSKNVITIQVITTSGRQVLSARR